MGLFSIPHAFPYILNFLQRPCVSFTVTENWGEEEGNRLLHSTHHYFPITESEFSISERISKKKKTTLKSARDGLSFSCLSAFPGHCSPFQTFPLRRVYKRPCAFCWKRRSWQRAAPTVARDQVRPPQRPRWRCSFCTLTGPALGARLTSLWNSAHSGMEGAGTGPRPCSPSPGTRHHAPCPQVHRRARGTACKRSIGVATSRQTASAHSLCPWGQPSVPLGTCATAYNSKNLETAQNPPRGA